MKFLLNGLQRCSKASARWEGTVTVLTHMAHMYVALALYCINRRSKRWYTQTKLIHVKHRIHAPATLEQHAHNQWSKLLSQHMLH